MQCITACSSYSLFCSYKPIHLSQLLAPVRDEFERLFMASFSGKKNKRFLEEVQVMLSRNQNYVCRIIQYVFFFVVVVCLFVHLFRCP